MTDVDGALKRFADQSAEHAGDADFLDVIERSRRRSSRFPLSIGARPRARRAAVPLVAVAAVAATVFGATVVLPAWRESATTAGTAGDCAGKKATWLVQSRGVDVGRLARAVEQRAAAFTEDFCVVPRDPIAPDRSLVEVRLGDDGSRTVDYTTFSTRFLVYKAVKDICLPGQEVRTTDGGDHYTAQAVYVGDNVALVTTTNVGADGWSVSVDLDAAGIAEVASLAGTAHDAPGYVVFAEIPGGRPVWSSSGEHLLVGHGLTEEKARRLADFLRAEPLPDSRVSAADPRDDGGPVSVSSSPSTPPGPGGC
ncbi:MAG: hypothetical protein JWM93_3106 [Frankiales bacterium]|nr:hypothetical protein [Frankiales bacterium]